MSSKSKRLSAVRAGYRCQRDFHRRLCVDTNKSQRWGQAVDILPRTYATCQRSRDHQHTPAPTVKKPKMVGLGTLTILSIAESAGRQRCAALSPLGTDSGSAVESISIGPLGSDGGIGLELIPTTALSATDAGSGVDTAPGGPGLGTDTGSGE